MLWVQLLSAPVPVRLLRRYDARVPFDGRHHSALSRQDFRTAARAASDLHLEVPAVPYQELRSRGDGVSSAQMRERVDRARATQAVLGFYNALIPQRALRELCGLDDAGERTLDLAVRRMGLPARAHAPHPEGRAYHAPTWPVRKTCSPTTSPKPSSTARSTAITELRIRRRRRFP
jgi:hypothetical protein